MKGKKKVVFITVNVNGIDEDKWFEHTANVINGLRTAYADCIVCGIPKTDGDNSIVCIDPQKVSKEDYKRAMDMVKTMEDYEYRVEKTD